MGWAPYTPYVFLKASLTIRTVPLLRYRPNLEPK